MNVWAVLITGYALSVLVETPILVVGLSRVHSLGRRLFAGVWLTACTYPLVVLVLPALFSPTESRWTYLAVAELSVPLCEYILFRLALARAEARRYLVRDCLAITLANLASFATGEWLWGMAF